MKTLKLFLKLFICFCIIAIDFQKSFLPKAFAFTRCGSEGGCVTIPDQGGDPDGDSDGEVDPNYQGGHGSTTQNGGVDSGNRFLDSDKTDSSSKSDSKEERLAKIEKMSGNASNALNNVDNDIKNQFPNTPTYRCSVVDCNLKNVTVPPLHEHIGNDNTKRPDEYFKDLFKGAPDPSNGYLTDVVGGLGGRNLDNEPYVSAHAKELDDLRKRLVESSAKGPQQWEAKRAASKTIREADNAYLENKNELGDILKDAGKLLVDIATDIIPFTSIPKDAYRLLVGKDPVTGATLSGFERALAGGFMAGAILTVGASNTLKFEIQTTKALVNATEAEFRMAEKLTEVIGKSPLKVEVLLKGKGEKFTVIGRDMSRVSEVGEALRKESIDVSTLDKFSDAADKDWQKRLDKYVLKNGDRIPSDEVEKSLRYAENKTWLRSAIEQGDAIIDLGNPMAKEFSAFYEMEKNMVLKYLKKAEKW